MSSAFRVTQRSITTSTMKGLQANQTRMQQLQVRNKRLQMG